MKNIVFMGTPSYASEILRGIVESGNYNVVSVYTQPDKLFGRTKEVKESEVKIYAKEANLTICQPNRLDQSVVQNLKESSIDYIVVAAYGKLLPKSVIDIAPCINLHASLLPQYRGASPIHQSLLNGDTSTGVTAMNMDVGLDTGDILLTKEVGISSSDDITTLCDKLTTIASSLIVEVLDSYEQIKPIKQDDALATHCSKVNKSEGEIDFSNATKIYNRYRAFKLWPTIFCKNGLKLKQIELNETNSVSKQKGKILNIEKSHITVSCSSGSLNIYRVQANGKKEVDAYSYCNGMRLKEGDSLV